MHWSLPSSLSCLCLLLLSFLSSSFSRIIFSNIVSLLFSDTSTFSVPILSNYFSLSYFSCSSLCAVNLTLRKHLWSKSSLQKPWGRIHKSNCVNKQFFSPAEQAPLLLSLPVAHLKGYQGQPISVCLHICIHYFLMCAHESHNNRTVLKSNWFSFSLMHCFSFLVFFCCSVGVNVVTSQRAVAWLDFKLPAAFISALILNVNKGR